MEFPCWSTFSGFLLAAAATVPLLSARADSNDEISEQRLSLSTVLVLASKQPQDLEAPWRKRDVTTEKYFGTFVSGDKILTTADAVADATFLQMIRIGENRTTPLTVRAIDRDLNLALLQPSEPLDQTSITPLSIGVAIAPGSEVQIFNFRYLERPTLFKTTLSKIALRDDGIDGGYAVPSYVFSIKESNFGWAEPVMKDGRLVGLASDQTGRFVGAIPATLIRHFLDDVDSGVYRGAPEFGLVTRPLVSADARSELKTETRRGVRVSQVTGDPGRVGHVKVDDVLVEVDGYKLDDYGQIEHPTWGKVDFRTILASKYAGDDLVLELLRNGRKIRITIALGKLNAEELLVPLYHATNAEPHLIVGGLLFQELSVPFLETWGRNWPDEAPVALAYSGYFGRHHPQTAGERIIVLSRIFGDRINHGYESLSYLVLDRANGQKVDSIADLRQALARPILKKGEAFLQLVFGDEGGEAVFRANEINGANRRIADTYGILSPRSFYPELAY